MRLLVHMGTCMFTMKTQKTLFENHRETSPDNTKTRDITASMGRRNSGHRQKQQLLICVVIHRTDHSDTCTVNTCLCEHPTKYQIGQFSSIPGPGSLHVGIMTLTHTCMRTGLPESANVSGQNTSPGRDGSTHTHSQLYSPS